MDIVEQQLFDLVIGKKTACVRHRRKLAVTAADQKCRLLSRIAHTLRSGDGHGVKGLRNARKFYIRNLNRQQLVIARERKRHIAHRRHRFVERVHQQAPHTELLGAHSLFGLFERVVHFGQSVGHPERFEQLPKQKADLAPCFLFGIFAEGKQRCGDLTAHRFHGCKRLFVRVGKFLRIASRIERERFAQPFAAEVPDIDIVFKGAYFLFGNLSQACFEQRKKILARKAVRHQAKDGVHQTHCRLDGDVLTAVHKIRYIVFFEHHVENAPVGLTVAADDGNVTVAQAFLHHQPLDAPCDKFALVVEVCGAVKDNVLRRLLTRLGVTAKHILLQSSEVVARKPHGRGQLDRRFYLRKILLCHLGERVARRVGDLEHLVMLPRLRVKGQRYVDLTAARKQDAQHLELHLGEAAERVDKEDAVFKKILILQKNIFQPLQMVERIHIALRQQRVKGIEHQGGLAQLGLERLVVDMRGGVAQPVVGNAVFAALRKGAEQHIRHRAVAPRREQGQLFAELIERNAHQNRTRAVVDHVGRDAARLREHVAAHAVKAKDLHALAEACAEPLQKGFFGFKGALVGHKQEHLFLAALHQLPDSVMYGGGFTRAASAKYETQHDFLLSPIRGTGQTAPR